MKIFFLVIAYVLNSLAFKLNVNVKRTTLQAVPSLHLYNRGLIDYIGNTNTSDANLRWSTDSGPTFAKRNMSAFERFLTSFRLWKQPFWKKISGEFVLNVKLGGVLSLESTQQGGFPFSGGEQDGTITSLADFQSVMQLAASDPRVKAVLLDIQGFGCGYAKLQEAQRVLKYFRESGKEVIAYASVGSEKELYLALGCNEVYIAPGILPQLLGLMLMNY